MDDDTATSAAVWILGDLRYVTPTGEGDVGLLRGRQPRLLLARLAATPRAPVACRELAETLWGDRPPAAWRRTLRSVVSRLRHGLAAAGWPAWDPIRSTFDAYALSCDTRLWVDAPFARRAVSTAEVALAAGDLGRAATAGEAAWQLARRAPVLSGDWGFGQRLARSMADTAHRAAMVTARAWVRADDPEFASQFARAAVDVAPQREDGWRLLLEAHGRRNDVGAVAAAFDEMTAMFEAELGVSPHATTFALYRRLVGVSRASVPAVAATPGGR